MKNPLMRTPVFDMIPYIFFRTCQFYNVFIAVFTFYHFSYPTYLTASNPSHSQKCTSNISLSFTSKQIYGSVLLWLDLLCPQMHCIYFPFLKDVFTQEQSFIFFLHIRQSSAESRSHVPQIHSFPFTIFVNIIMVSGSYSRNVIS